MNDRGEFDAREMAIGILTAIPISIVLWVAIAGFFWLSVQ